MTTPNIPHDLPRLDQLNERVARDNVRVQAFLDMLPEKVDALLAVARGGDWSQLAQMSRRMAVWSGAAGYAEIRQRAEFLAATILRPGDPRDVNRAVIRLASACGRARPHAQRVAAPTECQTMKCCDDR